MMFTSRAVTAATATAVAAAMATMALRLNGPTARLRLSHGDPPRATLVADSSRWPTDPWQRTHEISCEPAWAGVPMASTTGSWQRRQFASAIFRLVGVARIGSGNVPVVK